MKTSSAKNKGRKLQKFVAEKLAETYNVDSGNFVSRPMGSPGADIIISPQIKEISKLGKPLSIECKNVEAINLRAVYQAHADKYPDSFNVLVHKKNKHKEIVVLSLTDFLTLLKLSCGEINGTK